jgi:hypothetical protein
MRSETKPGLEIIKPEIEYMRQDIKAQIELQRAWFLSDEQTKKRRRHHLGYGRKNKKKFLDVEIEFG